MVRRVFVTLIIVIVMQWAIMIYLMTPKACGTSDKNEKAPLFIARHNKEPIDIKNATLKEYDVFYAKAESQLWSDDEMHIRSCFHDPSGHRILCLVDIDKYLLNSNQLANCPDGKEGEFVPLLTNEYRHIHKFWLSHSFGKVICHCTTSDCFEYQSFKDSGQFALTQINSNHTWYGPLMPVKRNPTYKYRICTVTAVLRHKPTALDIWLAHHWAAGVDHMFMYSSQFHIPTLVYNSLKEIEYIEEIEWPAHYGTNQTSIMGQNLAYVDALFRFRGQCEWTLFLDTDDYFWNEFTNHHIPTTLDKFIRQWGNDYHTLLMDWIHNYPTCDIIRNENENDFINASMFGSGAGPTTTKMMTKTEYLEDIGIHNAFDGHSHRFLGTSALHFRFFSSREECTKKEFWVDSKAKVSQPQIKRKTRSRKAI